ncbi:MAG: hypothetical protein WDN75_19855 [Bacteroidota bacterium]
MITVASILAPMMNNLGFESETSKALAVVGHRRRGNGGIACKRQLILDCNSGDWNEC